ncbi:MAG: hypothetical protein AB7D39_05155 [Pseudodesulfovibrio sp.]|uniref:hypothetical protein n=1 Tax=Pseudodesulfovibrio sp. TaxID=2035812 RepID=UPI003D132A1B
MSAKKIINILRNNNIDCLPNERFTLNVEMFPDTVEESIFPNQVLFEHPKLKESKKALNDDGRSLFRFFLDGAQRSYRVMEASIRNHYLPICAGQIGVAVLERMSDGTVSPVTDLTCIRNILVIPDLLSDAEVKEIEGKINKELLTEYHFTVVCYSLKEDKDPGDLGRAKIIHEMQLLELETIHEMIKQNLITDRRMLAKDGGLQYSESKKRQLNLSNTDIVQLRNVIGVAKSFKPTLSLGKGRKRQDLGNLTKGLGWKERTTVICPDKGKKQHGWWYLRIRPCEQMKSPLQGIVKIEIFATGDEVEDGIATTRADTISSYVLAERNVTPYKADPRWATHLYPIYLTETYLRSLFLSHTRFKAMII